MSDNGTAWTQTETGKILEAKLTNEQTLQVFNRLLDRIDTLENAVEKLTTIIQQGPGMTSMVADMVDEGYRNAAQKGIDIEERLGTALQLAEKLTSPVMVENLNNVFTLAEQAPGLVSMVADMTDEAYRNAAKSGVNIEERLGTALQLAEKLTSPAMVENLNNVFTLAEQAPGLVSMVADMTDEAYRNAAKSGVNIEERLGTALQLAEKLTSPAMVENLNNVFTLAEQAPGLVSMVADMTDEAYRNAANKGIDIDQRFGLVAKAAERLTAPSMIDNLNKLLEFTEQAPGLIAMTMDIVDDNLKALNNSGLDLQAVGKFMGNTGQALSKAISQPTEKMGIFGLMRALNDSDRQKALGFLMNLTKELGKTL